MENLYFNNTEIKDGFWKFYENLNKEVTINAVYNRFKETGRFDALKCNWKKGMPNEPDMFWDSDVAKWIEAVAYICEKERNPKLEMLVDEMVDDIERNQLSNGYFNSYFVTITPSETYSNRRWHELYCTGHLIEAAIAYHKATGKDKLLKCVLKNVDHIYNVFVVEQSAAFVTPGHSEIELALLKLYEYLGDKKHLDLARFFIDQRGNNEKEEKLPYYQADLPLREVDSAKGHAVRACYLYTAMAMLARIDKDDKLLEACKRIFKNITTKKMSITGGVGTDHLEEKFSYDYDIPNSDTYNETCAAISLAMFAGAMQEIEASSEFGDVIERIYYNGFISGLSLDGDKFFYTNPLEIDQKKYARSTYQPISQRVHLFACSCCPPNVTRMLATVPRYEYTVDGNNIYCNQFISGETNFEIDGKKVTVIQQTNYPSDGKINFSFKGESAKLHVRIPSWCVEYEGQTENGYAVFDVKDGDEFTVDLPMEVHFIEANPNIQDNSGRYAVTRGPIVYCMESIDNGENLRDITLLENGKIVVGDDETFPIPVLYIDAQRRKPTEEIYRIKTNNTVDFTAKLIPYFCFANREKTDMLVWTMVK